VLAKVQSAGVLGVEAYGVCAEVDVALGLPGYHLVGLGAGAVREGAVRVRAALEHSGWKLPARRVTVNLAPADVRKDGAAYDLPVAVGLLAAHELVPRAALEGLLLLGELSLDGTLRRVAGGLPVALFARTAGLRGVVLPRACAEEAAALADVTIYGASSLAEVAAHLSGAQELARVTGARTFAPAAAEVDLTDIRGLEAPKLALEVAAAGGHNLLFLGPPGSGKSMLAQRLPGILPPLDESEALETSIVYSAAGQPTGGGLLRARPFRAPHHDVSLAGLIGGGVIPRPGEISLAHNGVLFLDEIPEFKRPVLEALRQPLEDRAVTIVRTRAAARFPASFTLVGAMNPCPCGYYGSSIRACLCGAERVRRYRGRLSGPLIDRFDLHVDMPHVPLAEISHGREGEPTEIVLSRVLEARERQRRRFAGTRRHANAELGPREIARHCSLSPQLEEHLARVAERRGMSTRGMHRTLKVARTLADLAAKETIDRDHLQCAIDFRALDQEVAA
jgi:magnesium chelatase family protein